MKYQKNRKKKNQRSVGAAYEKMAGAYLENLGYEIVEYNFRCRMGEIDIIARDGGYLVFCEVKYRSKEESGYPLEAVDARKQQVISKCAAYYLMKENLWEIPCRFDVVSIEGEKICVVQNAFDAVD